MTTHVIACEMQPVTAEGLRALFGMADDLAFTAASSLEQGLQLAGEYHGAVVLLDKAFGARPISDALAWLEATSHAAVVWGIGMTEPETVRYLRAGARGVLSKSAPLDKILACVRTVANGGTWTEVQVALRRRPGQPRTSLTPREREVLELVGQGFKNREVADELGIRPGTVKVHLKHIFEKTGASDRYALALAGLRR